MGRTKKLLFFHFQFQYRGMIHELTRDASFFMLLLHDRLPMFGRYRIYCVKQQRQKCKNNEVNFRKNTQIEGRFPLRLLRLRLSRSI